MEYDGVLYYPTGADDIFAVSAASGKILWEHEGELPASTATCCCGWDNRGVAIGGGMVYSRVLNGSVEALNQQTGEVVWKTELGEPAEGFTVTIGAAVLRRHDLHRPGGLGVRRARVHGGLQRQDRCADLEALQHPGSRRIRA